MKKVKFPNNKNLYIEFELCLKSLGIKFAKELTLSKLIASDIKFPNWRYDYAIYITDLLPANCILLEIDGAVFSGGRHTRGYGFSDDCIKKAVANWVGFRCFSFTSTQIIKNPAICSEFISNMLKNEKKGIFLENILAIRTKHKNKKSI
jgi:hypothetical protein